MNEKIICIQRIERATGGLVFPEGKFRHGQFAAIQGRRAKENMSTRMAMGIIASMT